MKLYKKVSPGEMLPPFYGIAWREIHVDRVVCLPMPFNLLAGLVREVWLFAKHGGRWVPMNPRDAYEQGRRSVLPKDRA